MYNMHLWNWKPINYFSYFLHAFSQLRGVASSRCRVSRADIKGYTIRVSLIRFVVDEAAVQHCRGGWHAPVTWPSHMHCYPNWSDLDPTQIQVQKFVIINEGLIEQMFNHGNWIGNQTNIKAYLCKWQILGSMSTLIFVSSYFRFTL